MVDNRLLERVNLMINNYRLLKGEFIWENTLAKHFGALLHASKNKAVNSSAIEAVKQHIKHNTGVTSYFRGANTFILANLLCFEENYDTQFSKVVEVYERLKRAGFRSSSYLPFAAFIIAKEASIDMMDYRISRMRGFYDKMKAHHFWLTSSDDYVFAAVLSATDLEIEYTSNKIEACYNYLHNQGLYRGNDLQSLTHILALGEEGTAEKCDKAMKLYHGLKERRCKLQYHGLSTLGVLTLMPQDVDKIMNEVKEVYDYLYNQDGYGFWSIDQASRAILAANLVCDFYIEEMKKGVLEAALCNSISSIIIAQQQAMAASVCAACSAAAASSNS